MMRPPPKSTLFPNPPLSPSRHALGNFEQLTLDVTTDGAMLIFLNGTENRRGRPNENYARELMELFTLGADRGAYTEDDVREDRKSTRLNSSHANISYAVFCL